MTSTTAGDGRKQYQVDEPEWVEYLRHFNEGDTVYPRAFVHALLNDPDSPLCQSHRPMFVCDEGNPCPLGMWHPCDAARMADKAQSYWQNNFAELLADMREIRDGCDLMSTTRRHITALIDKHDKQEVDSEIDE